MLFICFILFFVKWLSDLFESWPHNLYLHWCLDVNSWKCYFILNNFWGDTYLVIYLTLVCTLICQIRVTFFSASVRLTWILVRLYSWKDVVWVILSKVSKVVVFASEYAQILYPIRGLCTYFAWLTLLDFFLYLFILTGLY